MCVLLKNTDADMQGRPATEFGRCSQKESASQKTVTCLHSYLAAPDAISAGCPRNVRMASELCHASEMGTQVIAVISKARHKVSCNRVKMDLFDQTAPIAGQ